MMFAENQFLHNEAFVNRNGLRCFACCWVTVILLAGAVRSDAAAPDKWPKKQHPYLLFDQDGLDQLRVAGRDGLHARMLAHLRALAADYVGRPPLSAPPEKVGPKGFLWWHITAYNTCYEYRHALETLSFLAVLTGEQKYIDAGKRWLLALCAWKHWGAAAEHDFDYTGAWLTASAATSYDWLWPYLSEAERGTVREALKKRIRLVYRRNPLAWDSHAMWVYPATATAAVSILWEEPEATNWLGWFRSTVKAYVDRAYTPQGEGAKGVSYYGQMMTEVAVFMESLRHATGEDDFTSPVWRGGIPYTLHCWTGGNFARYYDREQQWDRTLNTLMFLMARKYRSTAAQWIAAHDEKLLLRPMKDDLAYTEYGRSSGVLDYVWYDPRIEAKLPPDTPCAAWMRGIGLVTMRSGWDENAICLSFKSGIRGPHESFAQNRFDIDACGERLTTEFYEDYLTTTDGFNVIAVNGKPQQAPEGAAGNITQFLANNRIGRIVEFVNLPSYAAVLGNARRAYEKDCSRYEREIFYLRPHTFVIIDRVVAHKPADLAWRLHTTGSISLNRNRARFELPRASLAVTSIEPRDARLRVGSTTEIWDRYKLRQYQWYAPYGVNLWRKANGGRAWPLTEAEWYRPDPMLEITPRDRTADATFVSLIQVFPEGRQLPTATSEYRGRTLCIAVGGNEVSHTLYYNPQGIEVAGVRCDGEAAAIGRDRSGKLIYAAMHRGTRLEVQGRSLVQSEHRATVGVDLRKTLAPNHDDRSQE
jgi:hypothetical protein